MKKVLKSSIFLVLLFFFSCQDVVDVNLKTNQERLVIEALIKWQENTSGNEQIIKLSKTSPYYDNNVIAATNASVKVKNLSDLSEFIFVETENGIYKTTNFVPVLNDSYELTVVYNNETYKATETFLPAPEILSIYQSTEEGFSIDAPEVNVIFQDFEDQSDYYRVSFNYLKPTDATLSNYESQDKYQFVFNDQFQENNPISIFYENEELQTNDVVKIKINSVSKRFYNFLVKLEEQVDGGFGPFSLPPANVKGNVVNTTNSSNYPYGYFSLNKVKTEEYIYQ